MQRASLLGRLISAIAVVSLLLSAGAAQASSPSDTLGVYAGAGDPAAVAQFESRVGHPVSIVHDYLARDSWTSISSPDWSIGVWGPSAYRDRMLYTVPMLPDSGGTLAAGAAGQYDAYFRTLAQKLVAGGQGRAILRLGPEFNGNWFKWTIAAPGGPADFASFWRRIVTAMRAVPGAAFRFDWSPSSGSSWLNGQQLDAAAAYPGDAYVDYIGLDQYDASWIADHADPLKRWDGYMNQQFGLLWHKNFAAAHNKPMTFPEWGLSRRADGYGGGDSPEFIEKMHAWITANNVAYNLYFDYADSVAESRLFIGAFPNATARFLALFGPTTTTAPPPPPPPPPAPTGYPATVAADTPAAFWRLGEKTATTATDVVAGANGTYVGGFTLGVAGLLAGNTDTAVSLNGLNGAVSVAPRSTLPDGDTFTLEAWVTRVATKRDDGIFSKGTGGPQLSINKSNQLTLARAGYGEVVHSTTTLVTGRKYHVVATKQGSVVHLYVDGVDRTGTVTNRTMTATASPLLLGAGAGYLRGTLDEVAVYTRALSTADVARHNAAGR
ncbi:MAG: hypothetical protein QOJ63_367 [Solirubrobacteraceae bacterium]|jgi:hypothetical protein|nr:hypothetical protein [Solirubrobacteraceae bacterium]